MNRSQKRLLLVLAAVGAFVLACSLSPLALLSPGRSTPQPPIQLRRCDAVQDVLCLVTFGIEPPDEMLIVLLTVPGLPDELETVVIRNDERLSFACVTTAESPSVVYCTGPQVPLGTTVLIEVFALEEQVLLASGEFVLTAFALPTVPAGGVELPTPGEGVELPAPGAILTPRGTRTPFPAGTPLPGTAYPNPTPRSPPNSPPISPP